MTSEIVPPEDVLYTEGPWSMIAWDKWDLLGTTHLSKIRHKCNWWKDPKSIPAWDIYTGTTECPYCGTEIPESLLTLWNLHNFDQIQEGPMKPWDGSFYFSPGTFTSTNFNFYMSTP